MRGFLPDGGSLVATVEAGWATAIAAHALTIADRLEARGEAPGDGPEAMGGGDLARLNPPASRHDPQRAEEFRRLTRDDLDRERITRLRWLAGLLTPARSVRAVRLRVPRGEAPRLAAALNDVRLVLAGQLGIQDASDAERVYDLIARGDGESLILLPYVIAGLLQETLIDALVRRP